MNTENNLKVEQIMVNDIIPNRFQPRKNFDADLLNELADSIRQYGIIQPLILRKVGDKFEIIAGERRYKAACMVGLKTVPSIVMDLDDTSSAEIALIENVQRKDLTAIEEAKSYKQILGLGQIKQEELARKIGRNQSTISNKLRLLNLSEEAQQALLDNKISERHARSLLRLKDKNIQNETLNKIIENRMTVRETDKFIKNLIDNHNAEEQTEEILDFSDENDINSNKKGDTMDQGQINNTMNNDNNQVVDNFQPNAGIPNIPDYDKININNEQPAYINENVVNNAQVEQPSRFFNYDNQAANMNFDSSFSQSPNFINNIEESQNPINNMTFQQENVEPSMNIPSQPNMDPNMQNNMMNQQNNMYGYPNQMVPQQNQYNQQNNMGYEQMTTPQPIYNNYDNNAQMQPNYQQVEQPNNIMPPQQMPYQKNYNMQQNIGEQPMMNNDYQEQNNMNYQPNDMNDAANMNQEQRTMIMQQDITGAVVVIRNTIMNLQNNGYNIEINEQDLGNLYQIIINLKK